MKLNYLTKPYLFICRQSEEEIDQNLDVAKDELDDDQIVEILSTIQEFQTDLQHEIDGDRTIVYLTEEDVIDYTELLNKLGFKAKFKELGDDLFLGKYDIQSANETFKDITHEWIVKNFTINDVLDKILLKGMQSLNQSDKDILESKK